MTLASIFLIMDGMPQDYGKLFYQTFLSQLLKAYEARSLSSGLFRKLNAIKAIIENFWKVGPTDILTYKHQWPGPDVKPDR